jgi:hypothetical protein
MTNVGLMVFARSPTIVLLVCTNLGAVHDTVTDRQRGCGAQTSMPANVCLRRDDQDEKGMGGAEIYIASAYT